MQNLFNMLPLFLAAAIISFLLAPLTRKIGLKYGIYALENKRTVHHGKIVRIGGLAIYLSVVIVMLLFHKMDQRMTMVLLGGTIVFIGGFLDDVFNLKPMVKLGFIMVGALVPILFGNVLLHHVSLFGYEIDIEPLAYIISFVWIIGVANAINLIDGLDGLASGISVIVLITFCIIGSFSSHYKTAMIAAILAGAIIAFLPYNFHPAKIFLGDCGALFIGYMIACLSLLGFKTSTFISLGFPIIILFVPLEDTILAIIRRKVKGQKITEADRLHLHHIIMYKIGLSHEHTVLFLYGVTLLFAISAIVLYFNVLIGLVMIFILCLIACIFIELTGMISPYFHPLIGLCRKIFKRPRRSDDAFFEANKINHRQ